MIRYALRNVLHYRAKYSIAFFLIAAFSACLSLAFFAFNGFWRQAAVFARSWGDLSMGVNTQSLEPEFGAEAPKGETPSQRLAREAPAFFRDVVKAERVVSTAFTNGDAYAPTGSWRVSATSLEKARLLADVDLAEGAFPTEGEAIVPTSMRRSLKVGDGITFVYKNSDLILNSLRFRVCGFFLPTSNTGNFIFLTQAQFGQLDERRVDDNFFVFLGAPPKGRTFVDKAKCDAAYQSFRIFLDKLAADPGRVNSGYYTAQQRYDQSKTLISFFELIASIFLVALVAVALATVINVLFITVIDRIKIIGTFMAYGMTRSRAIALLSSELLVFSAAACTLGVLVAFVLVGPVSSLKFTADNWTIAVILGGKRSLTIEPAPWAVGATYLVGMALPFAAAAIAVSRMVKGEVVRLLHFSK